MHVIKLFKIILLYSPFFRNPAKWLFNQVKYSQNTVTTRTSSF